MSHFLSLEMIRLLFEQVVQIDHGDHLPTKIYRIVNEALSKGAQG